MKHIVSSVLLLSLLVLLSSHEFWLQPDKFVFQKGERANIRFFVGENFEGENWSGNCGRINALYFYQTGIKKDLKSSLSENKGDSLQIPLEQEGTAVIAFNSNNSFIELEAAKFNDYLKEDGLTDATQYRKEHNETDSTGREFYQRSVKTIIQVGKKYTSVYKQPLSLPLDIIPAQNPYQLRNNAVLDVKVLFQNKPLSNALIKVWHRENNKTLKEELMTDSNGVIKQKIKTTGKWMISVVKMIRLKNGSKANWQSYWGSLTWGYD